VWAERPLLHWIYIGDKGVGIKRSKLGWNLKGGGLLEPHHGSCKQTNKH
jgi:hypothetical protein